MVNVQSPSQPLNQITDTLSPSEWRSLLNGRPIVHSVGNHYTGDILVPAPISAIWNVLTSYRQFERFFSSVESSRVLEEDGDRKVVEQITVLEVLMAKMRSRICTENTETPQERIDFRLIDGDLKMMKGTWTIRPVTLPESVQSSSQSSPNQPHGLLRQAVRAEAGSGLLEGTFGVIFTNTLKDTLKTIRREAMVRA
jgi:ribosome-associated toxin RatA of RatAB toxin-antitoxin module